MADLTVNGDAVQTGQNTFSIDGAQSGDVNIPENLSVAEADFTFEGGDLVMSFPDGTTITVEGYADNPNPPNIMSADGAEVGSDVVSAMAGPADAGGEGNFGFMPTEQAEAIQAAEQSGNIADNPNLISGTDGEPIGNIESIEGEVFAIRADGSRVRMELGDQVFQGDILESGAEGKVGVLLADETTFAMGPEGRMVLDEMVYDPATQEGSVSMSVLQGVFTFVSGQVAKTDPDAMTLDTPVATIGIRGTQVGLDIRDGESLNVHLMEELGEFVGEVVVVNDGGVQVLNDANAFTQVASFDAAPSPFSIVSVQDIIDSYGESTLPYLPTRNSQGERTSANTYEDEQNFEAVDGEDRESLDFLNDFQTDAGGEENQFDGDIRVTGDYEGLDIVEQARGDLTDVNKFIDEEIDQTDDDDDDDTVIEDDDDEIVNDNDDVDLGPQVPDAIKNMPGVSNPTISSDGKTITADITGDVDLSGFDYTFVLNGDDGANNITSGDGNDTLSGGGDDDYLSGGAGNDLFIAAPGGGDDTYDGGEGNDTITFDGSNDDLNINLGTGTATDNAGDGGIGSDTILNIENAIGGSGNDIIIGDEGANMLAGLGGDDSIYGMGGDDLLLGGSGNDFLDGGEGDDVLNGGIGDDIIDGGAGNDALVYSGSYGDSTISIVNGVMTVTGPDGTDTVENIESFLFADSPNLVVGLEDTPFNVALVDVVSGANNAESIIVTGLPEGASLAIDGVPLEQTDGQWIISGDAGVLSVTGALNSSEDFTLNFASYDVDFVEAATQAVEDYLESLVENGTVEVLQTIEEFVAEGGSIIETALGAAQEFMAQPFSTTSTDVDVIGIVDPFSFSVGGVDLTANGEGSPITFHGTEDQELPLNITSALTDTDGSEVLSVTISGLPTLEVQQVSTEVPVLDENGEPVLDEAGNPVTEIQTSFEPVTDAAGNTIGAHLVYEDANGNDVILPANDTGTYELTADQLNNLRLVGSPDDSAGFELEITAQVQDGENSVSTVFGNATVELAADADVPTVTGSAEATLEDQPVNINFDIDKNDISEHITNVTLTGIPEGSTLSIEYTDPDSGETFPLQIPVINGEASIPLGFLGEDMSTDGLVLTPPAHLSGEFDLKLEVTSTEPTNGDTATNVFDMPLSITAVADELGVTINDVSVVDGDVVSINTGEDGTFGLDISALTADTDGSEVLSIEIAGVPDGAVLSAGTNNGDGTWSLTSEEFADLSITPPVDSDVNFDLTVTVTNVDNNQDTISLEATVSVDVEAIADAANLTTSNALGLEDTPIALDIASSLNDTDGSESLSITISGVPEGATLSAGSDNGDGSWTLTPEQLDGLTVTPGLHVSGEFNLTVTATTTEAANGDTESVTQEIGLSITPDPDAPIVNVTSVTGNEDTAIALNIEAQLVDTDGSETLSVSIAGVPEGAVLSAGTNLGNGVWDVDPADLAGLTITPPTDSDGDFSLTVTATSTESNGEVAETTAEIPVNVLGVADAPTLNAEQVLGLEDTAIPLNISANLNDTDGSETLSITIENIPDGAFLLSDGDVVAIQDGVATLTPDQLAGLSILPPLGSDDDFDLLVTATSTESDNDVTANGQGVSSVSGTLNVIVQEEADPPALMLFDAAGNEDLPVPLNIAAILTDPDETLSVTVSGIPEGTVLSAGTLNEDGTWTLEAGDLNGLTMDTPDNYSGDFTVQVEATSTTDDGTFATTSGSLNVSIAGVADDANLNLTDITADEGSTIPLNIDASLVDTDGSETLSVTVSNIPEGAVLTNTLGDVLTIVDGAVELTSAQLEGLTMVAPPGMDTDFTLQVTATTTEADANVTGNEQGVSSVSGVINVDMNAVAEVPTLVLQDASGNEDQPIALDISSFVADASETLSITIAGIPEGAELSAGSNNNDGTWTLTPEQLDGLTITPPADSNENFQLEVTATSTEQDGTSASTTGSISIGVTGVADAPILETGDLTGSEDSAIALNISANLADTDGSESLSITIDGVPEGATLSAGSKNSDGSWTITGEQLEGLSLTPAADASGSFTLQVTATSTENDGDSSSVTGLMNVSVGAVADAPSLLLHDAAGFEDDAIPLEISTAAQGGDEIVGVTITGVPAGATLSAGTDNGDGTWSLAEGDLDGLTITPPENSNANFQMGVTVTSMDGGDIAETTQSLNVSVTAVADKPTLEVPSQISVEGLDAVDLDIESALTDLDGSESLSINISNIPEGALLNIGDTILSVVGGSIDLEPSQLSGLQITAPPGFDGNFTLQVTATSTDTDPDNDIPGGLETNVSIGFIDVEVDGIVINDPDAPDLALEDTVGYEDSAIALDIDAALTDASETLSLTISGVPEGATLSAGTDMGNGTWSLLPEETAGLTITPPADSNVDFDLTVTATSTTEDGDFATTTGTVGVDVIGVADQPNLSVSIGEGEVIGDANAMPDIPAFDNALSNVVMYLDDGNGNIQKIRVEDFPGGNDEVHDVNDLDLLGFVEDNYPGTTLSAVTIKAGNNSDPLTGPGEGPVFLIVLDTDAAELPLLDSVDETLSFDSALGDYVGDGSSVSVSATVFPLDITSSLNDTDGSETLSIDITGLPDGVELSAGEQNDDGSWTLSAGDLDGLTMTVPIDVDPDFDFDVTATATENDGDTASVTNTVGVDGDDTAEAPELSVNAAEGDEDGAIALDITAALTDTDGSETLSISISGVPEGAVLSAGVDNNDGTWSLSPDDLDGLTITPPEDSDVDFDLTVEATSVEASTGDTAVTTGTIPVTVNAVADQPTVSADDSSGDVAQTVALDIESLLTDTDGSESLSITIAGFPSGASLNAGTDNGDGSYTLEAGDLAGLEISLPENASDDFDLTVTATSSEAENQDTASNVVTASINVDPLASDDRNVVEVGEVTSGNVLTGEGDSVDPDAAADTGSADGNSVVDVSFGGVSKSFSNPDDVSSDADGNFIEIEGDHGTLKMYEDGSYDYAADDDGGAVSHVAGLTGSASSGAVEEAWSGIQTMAFDFGTSFVDGDGKFDPSLADAEVSFSSNGIGVEGSQNGMPAPDQINHDNVTGESEALGINLGGETSSVTLTVSNMFNNEDGGEQGNWQAFDADGNLVGEGALNASTVDYSGSNNVGTAEIALPDGASFQYIVFTATDTGNDADAGDSSDFFVRAVQFETNASEGGEDVFSYTMQDADGDTASATLSINVDEEQDTTASDPTLGVSDAAGLEDTAIDLDISAALGDIDGSETLSITIGDVPTGATLSAGTDNGDGTWTVSPEDLDGLSVTPPADSNVDFNLTVTATSTEENGGATSSTTSTVGVNVTGVADQPNLAVTIGEPTETPASSTITITNMGQESAGYENSYGYYVKDEDGNPTDGMVIWSNTKENIGDDFVLEGVDPSTIGFFVIPNGGTNNQNLGEETEISFRQDESGEWHVVGPDGNDLVGNGDPVLFSDPALNEGNFDYTQDTDDVGNQNWEDLVGGGDFDFNDVNINVETEGTFGQGTAEFPLDITSSLNDTDGSETLSITVDGLPEGATLSAGTENQDGSWTLSAGQLAGLTMTVAIGTDDFNLDITATSTENDGDTADVSLSVGVDVPQGDVEASDPTLGVSDAAGLEDNAIALDISSALSDTDGSETLSITIGNVPTGASLSAGTDNGDGTWTLESGDLDGLTITPPADSNEDMSLAVSATSTEANGGDTATTTATIDVAVTGVADQPTLSVSIGEAEVIEGTELVETTINVDNVQSNDAGFTVTARSINSNGELSEPSADNISFNGSPVGFGVSGSASGANSELGYDASEGVSEELIVSMDNPATSAEVSFAWMHSGEQATYELYSNGVKVGEGVVTGQTDQIDPPVTLTAEGGVAFDEIVFSAPDTGDDYLINSISFENSNVTDTTYEYPLDISSSLTDADGSETLSITVEGLPEGASLSAGTQNQDGSWTLSAGQLTGLVVTVAAGTDDFNLEVTATSTENDGDTSEASVTIGVDVPEANTDNTVDGVNLAVGDVAGDEDTAIELDIASSLDDTDGSEVLSITISGVPSGAVLSAGTDNNDGTWTLESGDLDGLTITPPADSNEDMTLSVTATSTEANGGEVVSEVASFNVDVTGVADGATVSASASLSEGHGSSAGSNTGSGSGSSHGSGSGVDSDLVAFFEVKDDEQSGEINNSESRKEGELHGVTINNDSDGPSGSSAVFDGNNDYVEVDHYSNLEMDSGTFSLWFNTDDAESRQGLFSKDSSGYDDGGHVTAWVDDGQLKVRLQSGNQSFTVEGGDVTSGAWHQMAFSFGPDGMKLYLNGEQVDSDSYTGGLDGNEEPLVFGANAWASGNETTNNLKDFFSGEMDQMAVYDRALTPTEMVNLYEEGAQQISDANGDALVYDLDIDGALIDTDGSESLSFEVRGLPEGVELSAGTNDGSGNWSLTTEQLEGLTMTVDPSVSDNFSIEVVAISEENDGDVAESSVVSLDISVEEPVEINGTSSSETLEGAGGDDSISGNSGHDKLYGYEGDDVLNGGHGNDSLFGDTGDDVMDGGTGHDYMSGGDGADVMIAGDGDDFAIGGAGNDTMDGGTGHDTLEGGAGNDTLSGEDGDDKLYGGEGDDVLVGGSGHDTLEGGAGDDVLTGGYGNDKFIMDEQSGHDIIQDIMEQDTIVFEGQEFHADDMIFNENEDGDVVVSFAGVEGQSVTLNGVSMDDLDHNGDGDASDGYSVTESDGTVTLVIDSQ